MAKRETLRIIQFDDETRELMQALAGTLKLCEEANASQTAEWEESQREYRALLREVRDALDLFRKIASFDISDEVMNDGGIPTFTFADLEHG